MDANGMIHKNESENSIEEEGGIEIKVIDEYQYRLIHNNRTP
jgi:hypothetical protein